MDQYDSGLLVINGIGDHPPTQTLEAIVEPLLARMRAEQVLVDAASSQLGDPALPGGKFDAIEVTYRLAPSRLAPSPSNTRRLLILEGRWQGLYRKADANKMSAWVFARQGPMIGQVIKYLARSPGSFLISVVFVSLVALSIALAGWNPTDSVIDWIAFLLLILVVVAALRLVFEASEKLRQPSHAPSPESEKRKFTISALRGVPRIVADTFLIPTVAPGIPFVLASVLGLSSWVCWSWTNSENAFAGIPLALAASLVLWTSIQSDAAAIWREKGGAVKLNSPSTQSEAGAGESQKSPSWPRTSRSLVWLSNLAQVIVLPLLFVAYTTMRAFIVLGAALAIGLFYLITPLLRLLASIPFTSGLSWWIFGRFESALFTGGFADMESVLNNHISASAVRARLRSALTLMRTEVKPDRPLATVVHSGGGPAAWELMSSDWLRQEMVKDSRFHVLKLITVAPALNWARRGMRDRQATDVDSPLVTSGPQRRKTKWLNVYSTWDPTPHGPIEVETGKSQRPNPYWDTEEEKASWEPLLDIKEAVDAKNATARANLLVRNLGAPVREEHREYWYNQEEVVPLLGWALDPQMQWSEKHVQPEWRTHWSNVRLGLVSSLVRVRLLLAACVAAILVSAFNQDGAFHALVAAPDNAGTFSFGLKLDMPGVSRNELLKVPESGNGLPNGGADQGALGAGAATPEIARKEADADSTPRLQKFLNYFRDHQVAGNIFAVGVTLIGAYLAMNLYMNLLWSQIARRSLPYGATGPTDCLTSFSWQPGALAWTLFAVVLVPDCLSSAFFLFDLPLWMRWMFFGISVTVSLAEFAWLVFSIPAARTKEDTPQRWGAYRRSLGRVGSAPLRVRTP